MRRKQQLLIVGGSFGGLTVLRQLHKTFDITLVDCKNFFEFTPSILECFMNPTKLNEITIPFINLMQKYQFKFIHGIMLKISENIAQVQIIDKIIDIQFDYCVVSTGAFQNDYIKNSREFIINYQERMQQMIEIAQKIQSAQQILIVGGGTVGVELAGELANNGKSVTLISRREILKTMPRRARQLSEIRLNELGVNIIQNLKYEDLKLKFDLTFRCTGNQYQVFPIEQSQTVISNESMYRNKQIRVDDYLHVLRDDQFPIENIFAIGDISLSSLNEEKTALSAELYAENVCHNLRILNKNKKKKLSKIFSIPKTYIISLGQRNAVLVFQNLSIGGFLAWTSKIFIEKAKILQYKGVFGFDFLWDVIHIILHFFTMIFMCADLMFGHLPLDRKIQQKDQTELKQIQKELQIHKNRLK